MATPIRIKKEHLPDYPIKLVNNLIDFPINIDICKLIVDYKIIDENDIEYLGYVPDPFIHITSAENQISISPYWEEIPAEVDHIEFWTDETDKVEINREGDGVIDTTDLPEVLNIHCQSIATQESRLSNSSQITFESVNPSNDIDIWFPYDPENPDDSNVVDFSPKPTTSHFSKIYDTIEYDENTPIMVLTKGINWDDESQGVLMRSCDKFELYYNGKHYKAIYSGNKIKEEIKSE